MSVRKNEVAINESVISEEPNLECAVSINDKTRQQANNLHGELFPLL